MAEKLLIVMANSDPGQPLEIIPPLVQAGVAAAMAYEVEVVLTGRCAVLAGAGVAAALDLGGDPPRTALDLIREAVDNGARFKLCAPLGKMPEGELTAEIGETIGAAYVISEAMNEDTVVFTY